MDPLARQLTRYVNETLGVEATITRWSDARRLAPFLKDLYRFAELRLLDTPFLLLIDRDPTERPPATVRKHVDMIQEKRDVIVVYARSGLTAYNRKRLVEQRVPFIVPGNQMYLPPLGLDFREHFKRLQAERPALSPATQVLVLHALLRRKTDVLVPAQVAEQFGYSRMTMTRAFDELEALELGTIARQGRERHLRFDADRRALWDRAQPLLRSPVTRRAFVQRARQKPLGAVAGLAALAEYSMLAPPRHPVFALGRDEWKDVREGQKITQVREPDEHVQELEIWSYRPRLFTEGDCVDRLSLYLTLRDNPDERVEAALGEMMRGLPW